MNYVIIVISIVTFPAFIAAVIYIFRISRKNKKPVNMPEKIFERTSLDGKWKSEEPGEGFIVIDIENNEGWLICISGYTVWFEKMGVKKNGVKNLLSMIERSRGKPKFTNIIQTDNLKWSCLDLYCDATNKLKYKESVIVMEQDKKKIKIYSKSSDDCDVFIKEQ